VAVGLSLPREEDRHLTGVWARHIRAQRAEVGLFDPSHGVIQRMRPVVGPRKTAGHSRPHASRFRKKVRELPSRREAGEGGDFEVDPLSHATKQGLERRETPWTEHGEQGDLVSLRTELLRHLSFVSTISAGRPSSGSRKARPPPIGRASPATASAPTRSASSSASSPTTSAISYVGWSCRSPSRAGR